MSKAPPSSPPITKASAQPPVKRKSILLWPREHGAYAELAFPLVTAWIISAPNTGGFLIGLAAVAFFLSHESVLVASGRRGARAARARGAQARRLLAILWTLGAGLGGLGFALLHDDAQEALIIPALLGCVAGILLWCGQERTLWGEVVVVWVLSTMATPIIVQGGLPWSVAMLVTGVFGGAFSLATFAVQGVTAKDSYRRIGLRWSAALASVGWITGAWMLVNQGTLSAIGGAALTPVALVTLGVSLAPPHPRRLRVVGWSLVAANLLSFVFLVAETL